MAEHVIIDTGARRGDGTYRPGCAVCGLTAEVAAQHPACRGERGRVDTGAMDGKIHDRRRKRARKGRR